MKNNNVTGHFLAIVTVLLWGTTFVSTKILLDNEFTPIEILFYRFILGTIALYFAYPHLLKGTTFKQEIFFAAAGFSGVTLYFLLENIALTYTFASNAALIASTAPFFTMLLSYVFLKDEQLRVSFFIGFLVSIAGIALISFSGSNTFQLNPLGDFLAFLAAIAWAFYSVFSKKISTFGYNTIQTTRRVFAYGLFFMLFGLIFLDFNWRPELFVKPVNLLNLIFLGLGASAMCFVTWSMALRQLGAIKASMYIYMLPVITVISSVLILGEVITWMSGLGIVLTMTGLSISKIDWKKGS